MDREMQQRSLRRRLIAFAVVTGLCLLGFVARLVAFQLV